MQPLQEITKVSFMSKNQYIEPFSILTKLHGSFAKAICQQEQDLKNYMYALMQ